MVTPWMISLVSPVRVEGSEVVSGAATATATANRRTCVRNITLSVRRWLPPNVVHRNTGGNYREPYQRRHRRSDDGVDHKPEGDGGEDHRRHWVTPHLIGPGQAGRFAPQHDDSEH